ncbi:MAG TPA: Asp-tRNA(Asn)/Glu-tRNA(Gln) amidotransferase subunit GatB [Nitrospirae bacterium]|nr:Asp-tRNA(Asn)/Glu-tRNA(Gln) amidotransferase subunit GatB [Nitrospirota bacterium]
MKGKYEAVIGLEVHAQMRTETKIFCGCRASFGAEPNSQTCPVCTGMPGVLPVLNRRALEFSIRTGLAMGCKIAPMSRFARKNYFYPDLPKGYQISQYELPICEHGHVDIEADGKTKRIGITRIHMEDDAGKNIHDPSSGVSLVDLNRTGTPLMEIVSEPDMRTPEEAGAYMRKIRTIVRYLGVSDGNMEQGSLRCDANISIRPKGQEELGTKVELKNINSFRFVERAIAYEIKRQIKETEKGGTIVQETRLYDTDRDVTVSMRAKEEAHDYRYFPDPDLVPMKVEGSWIEEIRSSLPELPDAKRARYTSEFKLSKDAAAFISEDLSTALWFEEAVKLGGDPQTVANWVMGELTRRLNDDNLTFERSPLTPIKIVELLDDINAGKVNINQAKQVFNKLYDECMSKIEKDTSATLNIAMPSLTVSFRTYIGKVEPLISASTSSSIINFLNLTQITDTDELETAVQEVLDNNPNEVERFKGGDKKLMGFFVGQVMKATKGKANPKAVNEIIRSKLG